MYQSQTFMASVVLFNWLVIILDQNTARQDTAGGEMNTSCLLFLFLHLFAFSNSDPDTHLHLHLPPEQNKGAIGALTLFHNVFFSFKE